MPFLKSPPSAVASAVPVLAQRGGYVNAWAGAAAILAGHCKVIDIFGNDTSQAFEVEVR